MKQRYLSAIAILTTCTVQAYAVGDTTPSDTLKTYHIGEVVITSSTKETNNLRTLPGSVSLLSPQQIAGRQIETLKDISSYVPNLYMPDYGARLTSAIYIRGVGARSSGQSVGLYVDNAPYLDKSTFDFDLTDIQRIEVLRGPQGTLYGRNAMGGIINVYTISPFDYQGKKLSLSAGNYGQYKVKASHYGKLSNTLGFTAAAYYDHNDGFYTNSYTGKKVDKGDVVGGRLKLEGRFNPRFRMALSLSADYINQGAFPYGAYNKESGKVEAIRMNDPSSYSRTMLGGTLFLEYKADKYTLSSTTGYQYFKDDMKMDQDFDTLSLFVLNQRQKQNAISQELALKGNNKGNYQWSLGMFGFYNGLHTEGPVTFKKDGVKNILQKTFDDLKAQNPKMPHLLVLDEELYIPGSFETPSYGIALFHQSTYNNLFTPGLSLTAGVRLDYEKQRMSYLSEARMEMGLRFSEHAPVVKLNDLFPYGNSKIDETISQDFWQLLPKVSLKYECTPTTFTYLSVSKGYKTGGYNVQLSADVMKGLMQYDMMSLIPMMPTPPQKPRPLDEVASYKPEYSWNYEAGVRSELIDGRLTGELTLFYMDIRDLQLTRFVDSGNGRILTNAGKARSAGVEVSLRTRITTGLTADLNYGYTHATLSDYVGEKKVDGKVVSTDLGGNFIPYTPRHTVNLGLNYTRLMRNCWIDQFTASAQLSGVGKIYWTEYNDISQDFYCTLNAKVGVRKGVVNLNLWTRNLTGTDYAAFYFESLDRPFIQKGKPLQVGAEVSIAF